MFRRPSCSCFSGLTLRTGIDDDAHDVGLLHDQELLAIHLDLGAGPLAEQDPVTGLHRHRLDLAVLGPRAIRADGDDLAFHRLFLRRVRDDDPAGRLLLLRDAAHQHAVMQRSELHSLPPFLSPKPKGGAASAEPPSSSC
jgi:hypothetical protein